LAAESTMWPVWLWPVWFRGPSGCVARRSFTALEDRSSIPDACQNNVLVTKLDSPTLVGSVCYASIVSASADRDFKPGSARAIIKSYPSLPNWLCEYPRIFQGFITKDSSVCRLICAAIWRALLNYE